MNKIDEVNLMDQIVGKENPSDKPCNPVWYSPDGINWIEMCGTGLDTEITAEDFMKSEHYPFYGTHIQ